MTDFNLLPAANTHTNNTRSKLPATPKIIAILFEDLLFCVLVRFRCVSATGLLGGAGAGSGDGAGDGGRTIALKKLYVS